MLCGIQIGNNLIDAGSRTTSGFLSITLIFNRTVLKENEYFMAQQQYETAKKKFEYFMVLVDLAIEHAKRKGEKAEGK